LNTICLSFIEDRAALDRRARRRIALGLHARPTAWLSAWNQSATASGNFFAPHLAAEFAAD
jgi:hypothetical protein